MIRHRSRDGPPDRRELPSLALAAVLLAIAIRVLPGAMVADPAFAAAPADLNLTRGPGPPSDYTVNYRAPPAKSPEATKRPAPRSAIGTVATALTASATALTAVARSLPNDAGALRDHLQNARAVLDHSGWLGIDHLQAALHAWSQRQSDAIQASKMAFRQFSERSLQATQNILSPYQQYAGFWPLSVFAGFVPWALKARLLRRKRILVQAPSLWETFEESPAYPMNAQRVATPPTATASLTGPVQAQGVDLAARARFVAMNFALPEPALPPRGLGDWPLRLSCQPLRFTLTLRHAALRYRLEFVNSGTEAIGPLIVRAALAAVDTALPLERAGEIAPEPAMPVCHYLDNLPGGGSVAVTGELRLPLVSIMAMRLGTAQFLVPLMQFCVESAGDARPMPTNFHRFAIGIAPLAKSAGMQPFRLDLAPRIWRELTARRLIPANNAGFRQMPLDGTSAQS